MNPASYRDKPPHQWTRLERLQYLLDEWDTIFDSTARAGSIGERLDMPLLPPMANHPTVRELDRCLGLLRVATPGDYRHLQTHRTGCDHRLVDMDVRIRLPSGKYTTIKQRQRQRVHPSWLDLVRVSRAEQWLETRFRGDVEIPRDLWDSLLLPADTAAWAAYDAKRRARKLAA